MERAIVENMEKALINELSQGKELAEQLMNRLRQSSSQEKRDFLVAQILSSYEKSLSMLSLTNPKTSALESPHSFGNTSPRSVSFDHQEDSTPVNVSKKRKTMPRWTEQIKVCLGTGVERSLEDGYNWRKYGQKDILGSSHPRGYYRCTYRPSQGCLATKQVQRSDQDSSLFEVTYRGRHTCCTRSSQQQIASASLAQEKSNLQQLEEREKNPTHSQSALLNLKPSLEVKTEDLNTVEGNIFLPSSISSSSIESETMDSLFLSEAIMESGFGVGFSMPFSSPTNSESNCFSDLTEIIDSPVGNNYCLDFKIDKVDFELNFHFDSPEFAW